MYQQVTLAALEQALADRYESNPFWTSEEARRALNEGLRVYNAMTGFWKGPFSTVTVPDDPYVALPGTLVQPARVKWNGIPLEPVSRFDLDWSITNWRGTTTATPGAPSQPVYWARISLMTLVIYPADHTALNSITVEGVRQTPILVNLTDWVDLGQEQFNQLLAYAQHVLAFKIGGETLVASYSGWLDFLQAGAARNQQFAATGFYRKIMGLDQLWVRTPPRVNVPSAVDQALTEAANLQYPPSKIKAS